MREIKEITKNVILTEQLVKNSRYSYQMYSDKNTLGGMLKVEDQNGVNYITPFGLNYLSKLLIQDNSNFYFPRDAVRVMKENEKFILSYALKNKIPLPNVIPMGKFLSDRDVANICSLSLDLRDFGVWKNEDDIEQSISREFAYQGRFQRTLPKNQMGRYLYMINQSIDSNQRPIIEKELFQGMNLEIIYAIFWVFFAMMMKNENGLLIKSKLLTAFSDKEIDVFLEIFSADKSEWAKLLKKHPIEFEYFNHFKTYPLYPITQDTFVAPCIHSYVDSISSGVYWRIRDYYQEHGDKTFLDKSGDTFNELTFELLKETFGEEKVVSLDKVLKQEEKKADYVVILDEMTLIVEVKAKIIPLKFYTKENFDIRKLNEICKGDFEKALTQLRETEQNEKVRSILRNQKDIFKVVVILDDITLVKNPIYRQLEFEKSEMILDIVEFESLFILRNQITDMRLSFQELAESRDDKTKSFDLAHINQSKKSDKDLDPPTIYKKEIDKVFKSYF